MKNASNAGNVPADCHPRIRRAVDYWVAISPPNGLPGRQHFDPVDIPELISCIRLVELHGAPPRFKARLLGTKVVEFLGRDYTGQWLDEAYPDFHGSETQRDFLRVIETTQPAWKLGAPTLTHEKDYHELERVYLPLARDGAHVDMIVCMYVYHSSFGEPTDAAFPMANARHVRRPMSGVRRKADC